LKAPTWRSSVPAVRTGHDQRDDRDPPVEFGHRDSAGRQAPRGTFSYAASRTHRLRRLKSNGFDINVAPASVTFSIVTLVLVRADHDGLLLIATGVFIAVAIAAFGILALR
jgi:hypothetical protein